MAAKQLKISIPEFFDLLFDKLSEITDIKPGLEKLGRALVEVLGGPNIFHDKVILSAQNGFANH